MTLGLALGLNTFKSSSRDWFLLVIGRILLPRTGICSLVSCRPLYSPVLIPQNMTAVQTSTSLLALSVSSILLPAAFAVVAPAPNFPEESQVMLDFSRGTSIILIVVYVLYLFFQLNTHSFLYVDENTEEEEPKLTFTSAMALLVVDTILIAIAAEFLVGSIEGIAEEWGMSQTFVGLILLPIVGNAAEHVSAVTSAMKNKMELALGVAVGSSNQIALMVIPVIVLAVSTRC